jgi:hypothetical protein
LIWGIATGFWLIDSVGMQCVEPWKAVPTAAVVSAASGVTDELIAVVKSAAEKSVEVAEQLLEK